MSAKLPSHTHKSQPSYISTTCNTVRNKEADAAWKHYQETGLHITGDEVIAWLKTWGKHSSAVPKCHR